MIKEAWQSVRRWFSRMFGKDVIKQAVQVEPAASDEMTNALKRWMDAFAGSPGWLSRKHPRTINLASTSSLYLARLVNAELHFKVEGSARADFLQQQVDRYVLPQITARTEEAIAGGCIALKPYLYGGGIAVDFVRADRFYPLTIEPTGDVKEAVFVDQRSSGGYVYTRLEHHYFVDGVYHIGNTAYKSKSTESLGTQISLTDFAPWAEIEPVVAIEGISKPLFSVLRMPFANTVDGSKIPVSMYANAMETLRDIDFMYSDYCFEFHSGRRKMIVAEEALNRRDDGSCIIPVDDDASDYYKALDFGNNPTKMFEDYTPEIRQQAYQDGMNQLLRIYEAQTGVSSGTYSLDVQTGAVTATQVISEDRNTYYTVSDIQRQSKAALEQLIEAMDVMATLYQLAPSGSYELTVSFGDSVFEDTATEFSRRMQLVSIGMKPELLLAWYFEVSEEEAKGMLGEMSRLVDDGGMV